MSKRLTWCFTLNNYDDADLNRIRSLNDEVEYLICGKEVCPTTGTPHLQGFVKFKARHRLEQVKRKIGEAHCTPTVSVPRSVQYCKKEGDYFELGKLEGSPGRRSDLEHFKDAVKGGMLSLKAIREEHSEVYAKYQRWVLEYIDDNRPEREIEAHPLRIWQQGLSEDLNRAPDDRTVTFVVDLVGNSGKTWFCHYYASLHDNVQVLSPGKKADMVYALDTTVRVLFMDCPRSKQGDILQYDFLEEVKNGYIFSQKYESRIKKLGKVHVCVMLNEMPDKGKLSQDRYKIIEVTQNNNV